jgi:hypothetical protein
MGSLLIIFSVVILILQYQTGLISARLHVSDIYVYFGLFIMLLIGVVIQIDARK